MTRKQGRQQVSPGIVSKMLTVACKVLPVTPLLASGTQKGYICGGTSPESMSCHGVGENTLRNRTRESTFILPLYNKTFMSGMRKQDRTKILVHPTSGHGEIRRRTCFMCCFHDFARHLSREQYSCIQTPLGGGGGRWTRDGFA